MTEVHLVEEFGLQMKNDKRESESELHSDVMRTPRYLGIYIGNRYVVWMTVKFIR